MIDIKQHLLRSLECFRLSLKNVREMSSDRWETRLIIINKEENKEIAILPKKGKIAIELADRFVRV